MSNWLCLARYTLLHEAEMAKNHLLANDVEATLLNKQDSSYVNFGEIELLVPTEQYQNALYLLNNTIE